MYSGYEAIEARLDRGVLTARLSNPPCNVISLTLHRELDALLREMGGDDAVRVLVLESADPDFFLAHYDVEFASTRPAPSAPRALTGFNGFQETCRTVFHSAKPILAKIGGRTGGGGIELASSCDMRFGVRGKTVFNQMEVPLGILPGGSGTQNLATLMGRGRALEWILGADDIDAETAAQWGFLNRLFDSAEEMDAFVDALALRIAAWPPSSVALAKRAVTLPERDWDERLEEENRLCAETMTYPGRQGLMQAFLAKGGQTPAGENRVAAMCLENALAAQG